MNQVLQDWLQQKKMRPIEQKRGQRKGDDGRGRKGMGEEWLEERSRGKGNRRAGGGKKYTHEPSEPEA